MLRSDIMFRYVESVEDVNEMYRWLGERRNVLAVDTETGGLDWWREPLRLVQFGDTRMGWALDFERWKGVVQEVLARYAGDLGWWNLKFDLHFLEKNGVLVPRHRCHDGMVDAHLLEPHKSKRLKDVAFRHVDPKSAVGQDELKLVMMKNKWTWRTIPTNHPTYWSYACLDTVLTACAIEELHPRVMADEGFRRVYDVELALTQVITDAERRGIRVDPAYCASLADHWTARTQQLREWLRATYGLENATADAQVVRVLQAEGVPLHKRTEKSGKLSVDKEVLQSLDHPVAAAVLEVRQLEKRTSTYLQAFLDLRDDDDLLHASIHTTGARTGRMSCARPNLQNLPRRQDVRDAFLARDGNVLFIADYDQIELRILADFAHEESMLEAFRRGEDIHAFTARAIYAKNEIAREERQVAKNANYAKGYVAGVAKFAATAGVSFEDGEQILAAYDARFPGITGYQDEVIDEVRTRFMTDGEGWVRSPLGRRHVLYENKEYVAVNYLVQGTAADVHKVKLVELANAGLMDYFCIPIHDEGVWDVPYDEAEELGREVLKIMPDLTTCSIPLTAAGEFHYRWGEKYVEEVAQPVEAEW